MSGATRVPRRITDLRDVNLALTAPNDGELLVVDGATGKVVSTPATFAAANHTHDAAAIVTGTLANARTTATSDGDPDTIVARDAAGAFSTSAITLSADGATVDMLTLQSTADSDAGVRLIVSDGGAGTYAWKFGVAVGGAGDLFCVYSYTAGTSPFTIDPSGNAEFQGEVFAAAFAGDGANITGVTQAHVTGLTGALALLAPLASPTFTGTVTTAAVSVGDGSNIALGTTTGTKIGTAASQKLAFFNATPIVQPGNTTDLRTAVVNLGLLAPNGATPLDLNGGSLTAANVAAASNSRFLFSSRARLASPADGNITLYNAAESDFSLLKFGGTTNGFPALKRSSTTLQVRLADDSADAPLQAGAITATGTFKGTVVQDAITSGNRINLDLTNGTAFIRCGAGSTSTLALQGLETQTAPLLRYDLFSSTSTRREVADSLISWVDSTDASRKGRWVMRVWDTAAREFLRADATGNTVRVGIAGPIDGSSALTVNGMTKIVGAGTGTAVTFQTVNSSLAALFTAYDNGNCWIGPNPVPNDGSVLAIKRTTAGAGATDIVNVSNDVDANFRMGVSNTGESDKRAYFGPTLNIGFAFQTNATERARFTGAGRLILTTASAPTYADNAAAVAGGLAVNTVYKTATGELRIVV